MTYNTPANMGGIRFLDFPLEIRDLVYGYMFCKQYSPRFLSLNRLRKLRQGAQQGLAILQSSKQVNNEAARVFHLKGRFQFPLSLTCDLDYLRRFASMNRVMLGRLSDVEIHLDLYRQWSIGCVSRYWTRLIRDISKCDNKRQICHVNIKCGAFAPWPSFAVECQWLRALKSLVGFKEVLVSLNCPEWAFKKEHWEDESARKTAAMLDTFMMDVDGLLSCTLGPGVTTTGPSKAQRPTSRCVRFYPLKYASSTNQRSPRTLEQR